MEFVTVKGRKGGNLYYVIEDDHLYVRKTLKKSGRTYLICYESVLKKRDSNNQICSARCTLDEVNRTCYRNMTPHTSHDNHGVMFRDLQSFNAMKDHCIYLGSNFPFSARKVPIKEIYLAEMAKYVQVF